MRADADGLPRPTAALTERFTGGLAAPMRSVVDELGSMQVFSCPEYDACQGGCMAAKFFTGQPLDGPDPECVRGHGASALAAARTAGRDGLPKAGKDHSHRGVVALGMPSVPAKLCDSSPLAVPS